MNFSNFLVLICFFNLKQFVISTIIEPQTTLQTYIVHVDHQIDDLDSFLATTGIASTDDQPRILHRYRNVFSGFAAKLSADEVKAMEASEGFVSARPEEVYELHTTHTPAFLGLNQNAGIWRSSNYGAGVIIGVLDTGITPGHPSFDDRGMAPPPPKWKGKCELESKYCNKKLIGARSFNAGTGTTPADEQGHGTHTSSTAAGNFVSGANIFGNANGTAAGVAPLAHVAIYKVCGTTGCRESELVAGIDAAIGDGVDVLSLSLGGSPRPFYSDNIAIGAYRAMEKGIFVSCSAGNSGPYGTISNDAPWILTVGAGTIDRKLKSTVILGNGKKLSGESAFQPRDFPYKDFNLVYLGANRSSLCEKGTLNKSDVQGKIVLCEIGGFIRRVEKGEVVKNASGAGMILMNKKEQGYTVNAEAHVLPASQISYSDSIQIKAYVNSSSNPTARIVFEGTTFGYESAPEVAGYSSRGPSTITPGLLKPDIIGPGTNILAAWPIPLSINKSKSNFNMISGTSMSCPHLSGVAALLKSAHPNWSPAAIKSAIMTTADHLNLAGKQIQDQDLAPANIFATGAGHVNPSKANDPGLIYDLRPDDYVPYLCGKYTDNQVAVIVQRKVNCAEMKAIEEGQLNYPSFAVKFGSTSQTYTRTVTNVGEANSLYRVEVVSPEKVTVKVTPNELRFTEVGQRVSYTVTFTKAGAAENEIGQGFVRWVSGKRSVSSPIAVLFE